jgi:hypothetical protein
MPPENTDERLRAIEVTQAKALVVLEALDEKLDKVERVLVGDGNGMKGHNVRLDRLEQGVVRSQWLFRSLLVPVILLLVKAVAGVLGAPEA